MSGPLGWTRSRTVAGIGGLAASAAAVWLGTRIGSSTWPAGWGLGYLGLGLLVLLAPRFLALQVSVGVAALALCLVQPDSPGLVAIAPVLVLVVAAAELLGVAGRLGQAGRPLGADLLRSTLAVCVAGSAFAGAVWVRGASLGAYGNGFAGLVLATAGCVVVGYGLYRVNGTDPS